MADKKALIVALSGCSSSGKTTLARLLRDIFPSTFILHEDDFYRPETELPKKDDLLDWDCAESIDIPAMAESLSYIRQHAAFPPTLDSYQDKNSVGECPVPPSTISALKSKVSSLLPSTHPLATSALHLCILDGFLLYPPSMSAIQPHLDIKIFLRASYAQAKARREARDGYVTLEGFWADPPGYVDKIVWPNYVAEHSWMFQDGDVEGEYKADVLEQEAIRVPSGSGVDGEMDKILEWMVDLILEEMKKYA
ncbi:nicotinamide riboside kinase [Trichoderma asperellum]|uniref:Nicotinamide riboside kinase n=1 Tax=Trichoderma asperellum TaxID=101201 RepID=A0A6V8R3J1_TRIAP|nr:P-loop containing nucleoside triphosphate hydrolase protein [Trichoderma asperelloides]GFP59130.1 nicotinamide riboside kinase [Trichoderma asperellum]